MSSIVSLSSANMMARYGRMSPDAKTQIDLLQNKIDKTVEEIEAIRHSGIDGQAAQKLIDVKMQLIMMYKSQAAIIESQEKAARRESAANTMAQGKESPPSDSPSVISHIQMAPDALIGEEGADNMPWAGVQSLYPRVPGSGYPSINEYV